MKSLTFAALFVVATLLSAQSPAVPASTPPEKETVTARSRALELAGAFANDGYKVRDGFWSKTLESEKPLFIEVNLFAGNEYWFSAAALPPGKKIALAIFDEKGRPLESKTYEEGSTAAAGIEPQKSGRYFIRIEMTEGDKTDFCLVYSYK